MQVVTKTKILVVDDDRQLLQKIRTHLEQLGYEVATAEDGGSALKLVQSMTPDLAILDISFPVSASSANRNLDGVEVLRRLRESGDVRILMLSSTNSASVKAMAINIGADDYVTKPFDFHELSARIAAILRRGGIESRDEKVLSFRRLRLDPGKRHVWKDDERVELTETEFNILYALARRPEYVFTRDKLMEIGWKETSYSIPKTVDVHIGHIRKKIEDDPANPAFIVTVRGAGYRFEDVPE